SHSNRENHEARLEVLARSGGDFKKVLCPPDYRDFLAFRDRDLDGRQQLLPLLDQPLLGIVAFHHEGAVFVDIDGGGLHEFAARIIRNRAGGGGPSERDVAGAVALRGSGGAYPRRSASNDGQVVNLGLRRRLAALEYARDKLHSLPP